MTLSTLLRPAAWASLVGMCMVTLLVAQEVKQPSATPSATAPTAEAAPAKSPATDGPTVKGPDPKADANLVRLSKEDKVWIDPKNKRVVVEGEIALREGQLEMFACPKGTKEHESVVAVDSRSYIVHTALLAVGARNGHPVKFDPVYLLPTGDVIDILVQWTDADGKPHEVRGQEMVRHVKTEKAMEHNWVFGGSGFWRDEETGQQRYLAESGELICVSNFPTATLDLQIKSSQGNESLLFEAFTENIPPRGTKVRLVLTPHKKVAGEARPPIDRTGPTENP